MLEDARQHFWGEAHTRILDTNGQLAAMVLTADGDGALRGQQTGQVAQALDDHRHMVEVNVDHQTAIRLYDDGVYLWGDVLQTYLALTFKGQGKVGHLLLVLLHVGFEARDVEDVVDQEQQFVGALLDLVHEEGLVLFVVLAGEEPGIAHDVVQRCTYLVAHVRQEGLLQQLRLLGFLRLHSQPLLCLHHVGDVAIGAEVALHVAFRIEHGHHVEQQPYLTAFLVADLRLDGLHDASLGQVVHSVQRTVHGATEAHGGQSDAAQLRHAQLLARLAVDELEGVGLGVVVRQLHTADAQGIVDVGDVLPDALRALLQFPDACLLTMEGVDHLRDVVACHVDAFQLALLVADRVDGRLVVHLALQLEFFQTVFGRFELTEVDDAARQRVLHLFQGYLAVEGVVLQQEAAVEHLFSALHVEGLAGALVDVGQCTVLVVVEHVEQRGVEDGVIAHQQLAGLLLAAILVGHVVLDAHQLGGEAVLVAADDGDGEFIVPAIRLLGSPAANIHFSCFLFAVGDVVYDAAHQLDVVAMIELAEFSGIVFSPVFACFRQVAIVVRGWIEEPQPQLARL